jgi:hypothetical protein
MRIKKCFFLLFFITFTTSLLNACNLGVTKPESNLPPTLSSEIPVIPENTVMPVSSPTSTLTATPFPAIAPSATVTLFYNPTITSTPQWSACPGIVITLTDTKKGDMLHILRCEDGLEYNLGPLAKGVYAVGPNDKFLVYVTLDGFIYAARIGDLVLNTLFSLGREHEFTVFNKRVTPDFKISFAGEAPIYRLVLLEKNYDQKRVYALPLRITQ